MPYTMKFIVMVWAAFFARVKPVSTSAKPACMNITRKPATSVQTKLMATVLASMSPLSGSWCHWVRAYYARFCVHCATHHPQRLHDCRFVLPLYAQMCIQYASRGRGTVRGREDRGCDV